MVLAHDITQGLRTQDVQVSEDITFDTMLLAPNTLEGLTNAGFYKPSPIQLHGIPLGKCGFGKTYIIHFVFCEIRINLVYLLVK